MKLPEYRIKAVEDPDEELREAVYLPLRTHNQAANPTFWTAREQPENQPREINLFAFQEDRAVLGGLFAKTEFSWLKIDLMATIKSTRGQGVGSALVDRAEEIARSRGCKYAFVDTMDFQAPEFYKSLGYKVAGEIPDWNSHGGTKFFLTKDL